MKKEIEIQVSPEVAASTELFEKEVRKFLGVSDTLKEFYIKPVKKSIDARGRQVKIVFLLEVYIEESPQVEQFLKTNYKDVRNSPQAIIIGAGPAGLFAALRLIELGVKPIILERGKDVRERRRDLAAINKDHIVNEDSNYCFGEGGAGTYSDGKLYTRSKKRGSVRRILEILVAHGASQEILVDAHPHIGTNKLPVLVTELRKSILDSGGEIYFDSRVTDFIIDQDEIKGVIASGNKWMGTGVILATGHSARDIFYLLAEKKVLIHAKPFALGVRVEHNQQSIDKIQYHCDDRGPYLPASSYSLVCQTEFNKVERGVFSFCMCPGGFIVPSATAQEEVVVNGMSPSRRDSQFANSGIVVAVDPADLKKWQKHGDLTCLEFQKEIERNAWISGGRKQIAPAQRLVDFVNKKRSQNLPDTSYQPGLNSVIMDEVLPDFISERLRQGFKSFGSKMKGFLTNEAQIIGVESRTSSPVMVPRDKEQMEHIQVKKLFPCGEGAGYAGGIMSAAMDGERCAEKLFEKYFS